jgi:prepilin-type N-terminal cleavage/methylation domain-containing protein
VPGRGPHRLGGFTLLEMLAVVLIMGLAASLVIPAAGARSARALREQANQLANDLEYARQRTVMTAIPHRVLLDLDGAAYRVEWFVTDAEAAGERPAPPDLDAELSAEKKLDLTPPRDGERSYKPLPSQIGRTVVLGDGIEFGGVETDAERIDRGAVGIGFERDGSAEATTVLLFDASGNRVALDLEPLDDVVGIRDASS